jgi:murein DD-endopeptidase MepM/ murein hydrolase activator NlpD
MKRINKTLVICLLASIYMAFGQTKRVDSRQIPDTDIIKPEFDLKALEAYLPQGQKELDSTPKIQAPDITAQYWDTTQVRAHKNVKVDFPFKIEFQDSTYHNPIGKKMVVTSRYGWRWRRNHNGIDIDLISGDSIYSLFDGVVRFVGYSSGHGRTVVVRHYNGLETTYAHMSKYGTVKANDSINKGAFLGYGGRSGNARGSHLHLEAKYKGVPIHPEYLFTFDDSRAVRAKTIWVTKKWTQAYRYSSRRKPKLDLYTTEPEALAGIKAQKKIYIVKRGDTLSRIAQKIQTRISAICKANHIKSTSTLRIGQRLVID